MNQTINLATALVLLPLTVGCVSVASMPQAAIDVDFSAATGDTGWAEWQESLTVRSCDRAQVFAAAKGALNRSSFDVKRANQDAGMVIGERGMTAFDWNVVAGVYFQELADSIMQVRIIVEASKDLGLNGDSTGAPWQEHIAEEMLRLLHAQPERAGTSLLWSIPSIEESVLGLAKTCSYFSQLSAISRGSQGSATSAALLHLEPHLLKLERESRSLPGVQGTSVDAFMRECRGMVASSVSEAVAIKIAKRSGRETEVVDRVFAETGAVLAADRLLAEWNLRAAFNRPIECAAEAAYAAWATGLGQACASRLGDDKADHIDVVQDAVNSTQAEESEFLRSMALEGRPNEQGRVVAAIAKSDLLLNLKRSTGTL